MTTPTSDTPAARFRAARCGSGKTQAEVASALGVSPQRISHVECGVYVPTLQWLADAAARLGWDPSELDPRLAPSPRGRAGTAPHGTGVQ